MVTDLVRRRRKVGAPFVEQFLDSRLDKAQSVLFVIEFVRADIIPVSNINLGLVDIDLGSQTY
jgi:hypothetical protein